MRILNATLALAATIALCGCPTDGTSGTDVGDLPGTDNPGIDNPSVGGSLPCADYTNTRLACPTSPDVHTLTAVQTLQKMKAMFEAGFPGTVWMGGIAGISIDRNGKAVDKGPTISGTGFSFESPSGWTGNFCVDQGAVDDSLNYDTSDGACTAIRSCQSVNCNAVPTTYVFPTIDSPAAVLAAFPSDPADAWYNISLVLGNGTFWTVTRLAINGQTVATVKIDSDTGAVIP